MSCCITNFLPIQNFQKIVSYPFKNFFYTKISFCHSLVPYVLNVRNVCKFLYNVYYLFLYVLPIYIIYMETQSSPCKNSRYVLKRCCFVRDSCRVEWSFLVKKKQRYIFDIRCAPFEYALRHQFCSRMYFHST